MDDRLRETLSAMMDDEADELAVRRLLSHGGQDEVREQWQRWQQVRGLMHSSHSPADGVDVSVAVREVLDGRARQTGDHMVTDPKPAARWQWPAVAMVTMALLIGFGAGAGWESVDGTVGAPVAATQPVDQTTAQPVNEIALQGLDEQQWEHMSRYLLEHAQHNSVGAGRGSVGYARLVSASGSGY
ncbi:RseA family anti-sigma factor [Marinobacter sp. M216]|uniref:RseA family anti-sigma factor n=1 Tax=Marinobacter albus TaxID=3030833 RepID=A0ABT7HG06_9GAMM|nr:MULTISPECIES: RseA family anti-sigma factor [unclassified Marinobacter]MBW7472754.1 anti-sigma factor [Marinobacter sp. F4218]MDK9559307.1 RseA family anti-sigma factor [Marinobacter sp. M216]